VAENGAVLYDPYTDEMRLPFGEVPNEQLDTLVGLGVPLWRGVAIAGTRLAYDDVVTEAMVQGLPVTAFEDGAVTAELKHVWRRVRAWLKR